MRPHTKRAALVTILVLALAFALAVAAPASAASRPAQASGIHAQASVGALTPADSHDPGDDAPEGAAVTSLTAFPFSADRNLAYDENAASETLDHDLFRVYLHAGVTYRFTATGIDLGYGPADPMIDIGDAADVVGSDPFEWSSFLEIGNGRVDSSTADVYYTAPTDGIRYVWVQDDWHTFLDYPGGSYRFQAQDLGVMAAGTVDRADGADRYAVATALADKVAGSTQPTCVIVASGLEKAAADALAAGGLSGTYNAPIVLVRGDGAWARRLPAATASYLLRLKNAVGAKPISFFIVGGPASVPETLKSVILGVSPAGSRFVTRFGGADRYVVAAGVAARVRSIAGTSTVFITNGQSASYFYDTLAVSALCASRHVPVLLSKSTVVPAATLAEARRYRTKVVVGDDAALQQQVFAALGMTRDLETGKVTGGDWVGYFRDDWGQYDRSYMARLVAEYADRHGMATGGTIAVANALADSLGGGSAIGRLGGTLVFTDVDMMDPEMTEGWLVVNRASGKPAVTLVGGTASVSPDVEDRAKALVGMPLGF